MPSRRDKLIEKIRRRPPEAEFTDVRHLLEEFDWNYLDQICERLGLDD